MDNAAWDKSDTGDERHYGDTGVSIKKPNLVFTYTFSLYVLPGAQPNTGATYAAFFINPLSTTAYLRGDPRPAKTYLPLIMRNAAARVALPTQGEDRFKTNLPSLWR